MKHRKILILAAVCILLLCICLQGCGAEKSVEEGPETVSPPPTGQVDAPISDYIAIETAYGTLYYPDQWEQFIKTEQETVGDTIAVSFSAVIQDTVYPLFEVTIGGTEGTEVGKLTDADGTKRTVYMRMDKLTEDPALTDGEQNRLYAMQEDLNYLIDNLK